MAELIGGSGYDYVQDSAPTSPSIGDTWLDTSKNPPVGKIFADLGDGANWTTDIIIEQLNNINESIGFRTIDTTETFNENDVTVETGGLNINNDTISTAGGERVFGPTGNKTVSLSNYGFKTVYATTVNVTDRNILNANADFSAFNDNYNLVIKDTTNDVNIGESNYDVSGLSGDIQIEFAINNTSARDGEEASIDNAEIYLEEIETPASATVEWNDDRIVSEWSIIKYTSRPDGGTITVDILDQNNNILLSDVSDGELIDNLNPDVNPKIRFTLDRTNTAQSPKVTKTSISWL